MILLTFNGFPLHYPCKDRGPYTFWDYFGENIADGIYHNLPFSPEGLVDAFSCYFLGRHQSEAAKKTLALNAFPDSLAGSHRTGTNHADGKTSVFALSPESI